MKQLILITFGFLSVAALGQKPVTPSDVYKIKSISDPQPSPDGKWVAYVLSTPDSAKDKSDTDIWMVSWDGSETVKLTASPEGENHPRWSPDGKYLTFLSSRYETKSSQIWKMDRRGGEAEKLTELKYSISDYVWSPDSKKILLEIRDQESIDEAEKKKNAKPIVIDRYHFKQDGEGYLERKHDHLYLFDMETKKLDTLTKGDYDESNAVWSPDSKKIVFVSNRTPDPDRNSNTDLWVMEAKKGASMTQLTKWSGEDASPVWSPDGKWIAYLKSQLPKFDSYDQSQIALISAEGGEPKILNAKLDRSVSSPQWSKDSQFVSTVVEDDRRSYVAAFDLAGNMKSVSDPGGLIYYSLKSTSTGAWLALTSNPSAPGEICMINNGVPTRLTHIHDEFIKSRRLATVEAFNSKSKDGTDVGSLLFKPFGKQNEKNLPMILWIHGGPQGQDDYSFDFIPQILASQGYAVACVNYRGSTGRGLDFSRTISGDWGNKEVMDLIGAVDHLIKTGAVDPNRLAIGGWSYGGILTDYVTATDSRFKAAASGAGSAMQLSMYGTDQYVLQYENELGVPWKNMDKWMKVSYPFLNVEKIKTPTLYMVGQNDFNVPAAGGEQMYQALKSLGVPTEFVIYPGQYHGLRVPSYQKDRYTRYVNWFNKYMSMPTLKEKLPTKK